jgi:outer membrane protein TolC
MILSVLLIFSFSRGQDSTARSLTLEEAISAAMKFNPDLVNARLEVKKSDSRVLEAWGYTMPSVDVSGQYLKFINKPTTYFPDYIMYPLTSIIDTTFDKKPTGSFVPISMVPQYSASASITVKQILFNGAVFVGVGAASVYSHMARDMFYAKKVETVNKVRKAYYTALLAQQGLELIRSSLKNAEENLKNVQLMSAQGIVSEYDELRASVGVDNLRPIVIQNETNYNLAIDNLRNIIGTHSTEDIKLTNELNFEPVDDSLVARASEMVLESNPNLNVVRKQIDLNSAVINVERSNYLPTIAAFGSYSYSASKDQFNFSTNDFFKSSQVGLSLSLSLFQGLQTSSRVEQAQLEKRKTEEQRDNLEKTLKMGLRSILGNLKQAKKRIEAQEKTVETAEKGYKIVTVRFLANAATQLEVNDAQFALNQAKVNRIQAIYDYLVASADLDQIIGRIPSYVTETEE